MTVEVDPGTWAEALEEREPSEPGERDVGRASLVGDINRMRTLLEALRDGVSRREEAALPPHDDEGTPIDRLVRLFGLSPFEQEVLLLAAAIELDSDVASVAATILGGTDPGRRFGLALSVLAGGHWDAIAPASPLRAWRLVDVGAGSTLPTRPIRR